MEYVHVKNLERYNPGYKDRELQWCKAYFKMINADPEFEMLGEIDRWRFLAFVMLELQIKQPIPLDEAYLTRKGFDLKTRPISLTLQMLHNSLEVVANPLRRVYKEEEYKEEKDARNKRIFQKPEIQQLKTLFKTKGISEAEAEKFMAYYDSVGWVVGRSRKPMKSWQGAVQTWIGNMRTDTAGALKPAKREAKTNPDCTACGGSGRLPDEKKCWCWS